MQKLLVYNIIRFLMKQIFSINWFYMKLCSVYNYVCIYWICLLTEDKYWSLVQYVSLGQAFQDMVHKRVKLINLIPLPLIIVDITISWLS